jgi:hypothetical protein
MIKNIWYSPVFSSLLTDRPTNLVIFAAGGLHLGLNLLGLPGWACPIRAATGVPCPGCGLTTSAVQFLHGDFIESLEMHVFAPVFLFVLLVMAVTLFIPSTSRQRLVAFVDHLETRFGVTAWVLLTLFVYWGIRLIGLVSFPETF